MKRYAQYISQERDVSMVSGRVNAKTVTGQVYAFMINRRAYVRTVMVGLYVTMVG